MREFRGFDDPTSHNLLVLERQAESEPYGDHEALQKLLEHLITVVEMLPKPVRDLFPLGNCLIGDIHWNKSPAWCHEHWRSITADIRMGLDRVEAERDRLLSDPVGLADRRQSVGEQILQACRELRTRGHDVEIARRIQRLGAGTEMGGDARELERLFSRKRVADLGVHENEIHRRIAHIEHIAHRYHHR
ncbi:hypothetical protein [Luteibacter sp. 9135]|uniref:hypothetical protein n=1 Tax=Luteibacter sp. 9135 TaxID=1500893 RepID=UPI0005605F28|nr:hypothetical protein [Luteibacter sp. 9135]